MIDLAARRFQSRSQCRVGPSDDRVRTMLTTSELAEYLGVQAQAIYDLRADGRGPIRHPSRPK